MAHVFFADNFAEKRWLNYKWKNQDPMNTNKNAYSAPGVLATVPVFLESDFLQGPSVFRDSGLRATGQEVDDTYSTSSDWDYVFD